MPGRYDTKARRAIETARLAKYEKGTGESTSKVDNAFLGTVASVMGTRGLGRIAGAARAGKAAKAAVPASKAISTESRGQRALTGGKSAQKALTGGKAGQKALTGGKETPKGSIQWSSKTAGKGPSNAEKPDETAAKYRSSRATNKDASRNTLTARPTKKSPLGGTRGY